MLCASVIVRSSLSGLRRRPPRCRLVRHIYRACMTASTPITTRFRATPPDIAHPEPRNVRGHPFYKNQHPRRYRLVQRPHYVGHPGAVRYQDTTSPSAKTVHMLLAPLPSGSLIAVRLAGQRHSSALAIASRNARSRQRTCRSWRIRRRSRPCQTGWTCCPAPYVYQDLHTRDQLLDPPGMARNLGADASVRNPVPPVPRRNRARQSPGAIEAFPKPHPLPWRWPPDSVPPWEPPYTKPCDPDRR